MVAENTKVDWRAFEYIHSENVREAFQKLTEQLFCYEYSQPYGVYRFFNQPYIETLPIEYNSEVIGFQSKYYEASTSLSSKKKELCDAITGAKVKYSGLTRIIFYINKEFGCSTSPEQIQPAYMKDVEDHGLELGIKVEWRSINQVETMLLAPQNKYIREYFFSTSNGISYITRKINSHSQSILRSIHAEIKYQNEIIEIPQPDIGFDKFVKSNKRYLLIHGEGGCGKSAIVKKQISEKDNYLIWTFRATDFDCSSISEFIGRFGNYIWEDLLKALSEHNHKVCIVDSAEKLFQLENNEVFRIIMRDLTTSGWKVVITIRTQYTNVFVNSILQENNIQLFEVNRLEPENLSLLGKSRGINLPEDEKLRNLLCNLFYLNLYLQHNTLTSSQNQTEFLDSIWKDVICGGSYQLGSLHVKRDQYICNLVLSNANNGTYYYIPNINDDGTAPAALLENGIIEYNDIMGGYFVCHDVYEEIVLQEYHPCSQSRQCAGPD